MSFQGSIQELPVPDIIQLVSVSGKTGMFTLVRGAERGYIYLKNGQMVHAQLGDRTGEEAIYALAIWSSGDFQFTPGEEAEAVTIEKSNTSLLMHAGQAGSRARAGRVESSRHRTPLQAGACRDRPRARRRGGPRPDPSDREGHRIHPGPGANESLSGQDVSGDAAEGITVALACSG